MANLLIKEGMPHITQINSSLTTFYAVGEGVGEVRIRCSR